MAHDHSGRVAVITGAGHGMGRATALRLASEGAAIAVIDVKPESGAETVRLVEAAGGKAAAFTADIRNRQQVQAARDGILETFGRVDYLVNCAGLVTMSGLDELTDDEWDLVMDVNLKAMFIVTQELAPSLEKHASGHGAVVNFSSVEGEVVVSSRGYCQVHYNASKGGVKMLTKALAVELSRKGLRCNAVGPGPVNTGFAGGDLESPEAMAFLSEHLLVKRPGKPEEIAAVVSFLLSSDASYVTGAVIPVDGGWLTR